MNVFLNKKKPIIFKYLAGGLILAVFAGILFLSQNFLRNSVYHIISPVQKYFFAAGALTFNFLSPLFNFSELKEENNKLKKENENLLSKLSVLNDLAQENRQLLEIIGSNQDKKYELAIVDAIGLDAGQDFLLVNKGSEDGISKDMPVINSQNALFGRVFEVYKNFSKVMLISNKNSVLDVKIQTDNLNEVPTSGIVRGSGNLSAYLDLVGANSNIKTDDVFVTSALEGIYPPGLLVARIKETSQNDQKPFQTAKLGLFFNASTTELFVVTGYKKK